MIRKDAVFVPSFGPIASQATRSMMRNCEVMMSKSERIPTAMQSKFGEIVALTDAFAAEHLNDEYQQLIRYAVAALCRKRPSPLQKGRANTWAGGITHAVGMVNFLFDSSQTPHMAAADLYRAFGISQSSGQAKSRLVRDALRMGQMDPEWTPPSRIAENPMAWMVTVDGVIVDIRDMPQDLQQAAFAQGLIPYVPEQGHGD